MTNEMRLRRIVDFEQIEQLAAKRVYLAANACRKEEMNELWVQHPEHQKTASYGGTWGWYVGTDSIRRWYVDAEEARLMSAQKRFLDAGSLNAERGVGALFVQPLMAPAIQIADDGLTAKGIWYTVGVSAQGEPDGSAHALCISGKVAMDFIREDGAFRIWHVVEVADSAVVPGSDYGDQPTVFAPGEDPLEIAFGTPDIRQLTHDRLLCWTDDYPWMPEPYEKFSADISYGPEGWPHTRRGGFER